ncbi:MAG: YgjV family protein [Clostridia bacterium]|nr:YgjV family protein [Clostridia bacterium]
MEAYDIIAQSIGIVAMAMIILSFQQKSQKNIIIMQLCGNVLFAVNMFMIGAVAGGFLNLIGACRAFVYTNRKTFRADKLVWFFVFGVFYILAYALSFLVFDKEPTLFNFIIEFLPLIGMFSTGIAFYLNTPKTMRQMGLISSPSWLIYNVFNFALGGIICEILAMFSIVIGMIRHDRKNG